MWDCSVPDVREVAGVHDYDGVVMDLSPSGVRSSVHRLGDGPGSAARAASASPITDSHDEPHLRAIEDGLRACFVTAEAHRWNPLFHLANLDLSCYDRDYDDAEVREAAKQAHVARWPDAIDASLESLDSIPRPVAEALLGSVLGLAAEVGDPLALAAHERLVERVREAAENGPVDASLGAPVLERLLGDAEGMAIELAKLEESADRERDRLRARLGEACERLAPGAPRRQLIRDLMADHPDDDEVVYRAARDLIEQATSFVYERDLCPVLGGRCLVGPAPASRRFAVAMMAGTGAYEADVPGWYWVNPPDPAWDEEAKAEWRSLFSKTTLPAITVHEVTPGHYAHSRMLRDLAKGDVRRSLYSAAFVEGWAHYAEELMVEEGFLADDPRFAIGVWVEALTRVTRFAAALGVHAGSMSIDDATKRFEEDAFLLGPAARSEATRATWDPTYGRYTWGKLEILSLRDQAIARWGNRFTARRFHEALMRLGAPPLGTIGDAVGD